MKNYHVHENFNPHVYDRKKGVCLQYKCKKQMGVNNGHRFNVQRVFTGEKYRSGVVVFGTCSRKRLWLYLLWLNLKGYRKDKRKW